jgi:hypothetical protein
MSAPMFEQVKKSGICKTCSVLKGLIELIFTLYGFLNGCSVTFLFQLALIQSNHVIRRLQKLFPNRKFELSMHKLTAF